ncbi:MAG: DUF5906 domain-containing protein [Methylococcaceae bacterium]
MQKNNIILNGVTQDIYHENLKVKFTKFVDAIGETAKSYDLDDDGMLLKSTSASFWNGAFETVEIEPANLKVFIEEMVAGEFLVQGVHEALPSGNCPADAARLKDTFTFSESAGLLCIDTDSAEQFNIHTVDELNAALVEIEPVLGNVLRVMSTSASSYISIDGVEVNGLRGIHTFIPVDRTMANKALLEALHVRSINAGYGFAKVTKAGTVKINSLIDKALCTSNQPIFEGGAILKNPAITQDRVIKQFDGGLLAADSIMALSKKELALFKKKSAEITDAVSDEARQVREQFIKKASVKLKERNSDMSDKNSEYIINRAITNHELFGQFNIQLESGEQITVQNIIDQNPKYHLSACLHPLDDPIHGKTIIYSDQIQPTIHSFANGGELFFLKANHTIPDWQIGLNDHVANFNLTHAQVIMGGKHKIMRTVPAEVHVDNRISYEFLSQETLRMIHTNDLIQVGEKITRQESKPVLMDKITAWANNPDCSVYRGGVVFAPAKTLPDGYYNTWQGFAVDAVEGANIDSIKHHIENIVCAGQPDLIKYFYDWIAHSMQHPERPAGSALVLRGNKGTGKGILLHFIASIWGCHSIYMSKSKHLTGSFNGHLADVCFLYADEAFFSGDRKNEGALKALITEPKLLIERKGIDAVEQPNYLKIVMSTNEVYAVPASSDERRYCVFDVSSSNIGNNKYFADLAIVCHDNDVQSSFLYDMLNRDISQFSASTIPESQGLKDQRMYSLDSVGQWLIDSFTQSYFSQGYEETTWVDFVSSKDLYNSYLLWVRINRISHYDQKNQLMLSKYLAKLFQAAKCKGARGFNFGTLYEAIADFEKYEKVNLGLEKEIKVFNLDDFGIDTTDAIFASNTSLVGLLASA